MVCVCVFLTYGLVNYFKKYELVNNFKVLTLSSATNFSQLRLPLCNLSSVVPIVYILHTQWLAVVYPITTIAAKQQQLGHSCTAVFFEESL